MHGGMQIKEEIGAEKFGQAQNVHVRMLFEG